MSRLWGSVVDESTEIQVILGLDCGKEMALGTSQNQRPFC
jgi:hypothetical protein